MRVDRTPVRESGGVDSARYGSGQSAGMGWRSGGDLEYADEDTLGRKRSCGWKPESEPVSPSVSVLVLRSRPGRMQGPGRLTPKVGAGDHTGEDAQPAPHRLPLLGGERRGPAVGQWNSLVGASHVAHLAPGVSWAWSLPSSLSGRDAGRNRL